MSDFRNSKSNTLARCAQYRKQLPSFALHLQACALLEHKVFLQRALRRRRRGVGKEWTREHRATPRRHSHRRDVSQGEAPMRGTTILAVLALLPSAATARQHHHPVRKQGVDGRDNKPGHDGGNGSTLSKLAYSVAAMLAACGRERPESFLRVIAEPPYSGTTPGRRGPTWPKGATAGWWPPSGFRGPLRRTGAQKTKRANLA